MRQSLFNRLCGNPVKKRRRLSVAVLLIVVTSVNFYRKRSSPTSSVVISTLRTTRALVLESPYGLSNRLRTYGHFAAAARRFGWSLYVVWPLNNHLNARFDELYTVPGILEGVFTSAEDAKSNLLGSLSYPLGIRYVDVTSLMKDFLEVDAPEEGEILYIKTNERVHFRRFRFRFRREVPVVDANEELRMLEIARPLQLRLRIQEETASHDGKISDMIGVHIRMQHDVAIDVPGLKDDSTELRKVGHPMTVLQRESCHYSWFLEKMKNELKKFPERKFLTTVDHVSAFVELNKILGESVVWPNSTAIERCSGHSRGRGYECVSQAVIDQQILSKTTQFFRSRWSSYSEVIVALGKHPGGVFDGCGNVDKTSQDLRRW